MKAFLYLIPVALLTGCTHLYRSPGSGYGNTTSTRYENDATPGDYDSNTKKTAYELGKDPNYLTGYDMVQIRNRQKLRELERTLSSKKEREQYSKVLPWLKNDQEKIQFLSIPSIEGRQQWINSNNIWSRSQVPQREMKELVETQDIAVGMPQEYVRRSWGEPLTVEVSGNPIYKNERWKYQRHVSTSSGFRQETRYVYFEGGRVVGWETE